MIGSCPECKEAIRVPEGSPDQKVRCPLCSSEYELEAVFQALPPMLEIMGVTPTVGFQLESPGELQVTLAEDESKTKSPSRGRYQPQKRKQSSVLGEITKVVLGGLVAIPIGVLGLWWAAGRDPLGISEPVGKYVPWIVPEKLRGGNQLDDTDLEANNVRFPARPNANMGNLSRRLAPRVAPLEAGNWKPGKSISDGITRSIQGPPSPA